MISDITWKELLFASLSLIMAGTLLIPATATLIGYRKASIYDKKILGVFFAGAIARLFGAMTWLLTPHDEMIWLIRLSAFLEFVAILSAAAFFSEYIFCYTQEQMIAPRRSVWFARGIAVLGIMLWFILLLTNNLFADVPQRGGMYMPLYRLTVLPAIAMILNGVVEIRSSKRKLSNRSRLIFSAYILCPIVALIELHFGIELISDIFYNLVILLTYCLIHAEQSEINASRELQILEMQTKLDYHKMQPNIIFNSLDSIYCLCDEDSEQAQEAVSDFSDYLRMNIELMRKSGLAPFDKACGHLEKYLNLEKLRYAQRLQIVWDLQTEGTFRIPNLVIQPLVQNAIEHGINMRPEGGTVTVRSKELDKHYEISIIDDGVGFELQADRLPSEHSNPLGLNGVRTRLNFLCGGELLIQSRLGEGTIATILLPKEENRI